MNILGPKKRRGSLKKSLSAEKAEEATVEDPEAEAFDLDTILKPPADELLKRRRPALILTKKSEAELRYVAAKSALSASASAKLKKMHPKR